MKIKRKKEIERLRIKILAKGYVGYSETELTSVDIKMLKLPQTTIAKCRR